MATAPAAVQQELVSNECLHYMMCTVTAHLERFVEQRVSEAHDGLAARIEDVVAAHVVRLRAEVLPSGTQGDCRSKSCYTGSASEPEHSAPLHRTPTAQLQRQDDLEATVARVAAATARDMVALRREIATELRGVGSSVQAAMEQAMAELEFVKHSLAEIQNTTPDPKAPNLGSSRETNVAAPAELTFMKRSLADVQKTTQDLKPPNMSVGSSIETDVTTPGSHRRLKSSIRCRSAHDFSSNSSGLADPDACLSSESEGFATPPCNKEDVDKLSPDFFQKGGNGRHRASTWRPRSTPPAGDFVRKAVSVLENTPPSSGKE